MKINMNLDIGSSISAAEWVKKSRVMENISKSKAMRLAEQQQKRLDEEEEALIEQTRTSAYSSADLKGLRVKHGDSDFEVGENVILTLADSDLLETDEHGKIVGINEEDDLLENVNLADADRKAEREKRIKRNRQPIYSALDDAEFQEGVVPGSRASLLAQYDKEQKAAPKLRLGDNGVAIGTIVPSTTGGVNGTLNPVTAQSLVQKYQAASDYFSAQEYATFAHRRKTGDKKQRKTRRRNRDEEEDEETQSTTPGACCSSAVGVAGGGSTVAAVDDLDTMDQEEVLASQPVAAAEDRGSRRGNGEKSAQALLAEEEARRISNYNAAKVKFAESSKLNPAYKAPVSGAATDASTSGLTFDQAAYNQKLREQQAQRAAAQASVLRGGRSLDLDEDDPDLAQALAKARRLAIQQRKDQDNNEDQTSGAPGTSTMLLADKGAASVAEMIQQRSRAATGGGTAESKVGGAHEVVDDIDVEGRRADGTLVFNSTTEFTTRLQARLNDKARLKTEAAVRELERASAAASTMDLSALNSSSGGSSSVAGKRKRADEVGDAMVVVEDVDEEEDIYNDRDMHSAASRAEEAANGSQDEEDEGDDEQMAFLHRQPLVAKGMAATLALLKGSGELRATETLAGRAKDQRAVDPSANDFDVKLEYRDDHGRKLTQKEAFRQLSYRFHGYGPGQKKKEKRLKMLETQTKAHTSRAGILDGNGGMMGQFAKAQEAAGKAHITIQGGASNSAVAGSSLASLMSKKK